MARYMMLVTALLLHVAGFAQDPIEGLWYNEEKTAKIKIYKAKSDKFYGKIDWLKEPVKDGKTRTDEKNPDKDKRNEPLLGLVVLKGFEKSGKHEYEDGTIYDPKNGKTYSCIITHKGDKLDVRGYVGFSWIGRTAVWTRVQE
ncbi:MAG: DUF2147 domain-containing protein [Taibaiella sp.]|nr:DUF2147 domain-containing protein [Taibaiella sp.]